MSARVPPLAATITPARCAANRAPRWAIPGLVRQCSRSRANPAGSRTSDRPSASSDLIEGVRTSQLSVGRTTSAKISASSAEDSSEGNHAERRPRACSQAIGICRHRAPSASAPLSTHRRCQVPPGWPASQSSRCRRPRTRLAWTTGLPITSGAAVANRVTVCRSQIAPGQVEATGRGWNRARIASRPSLGPIERVGGAGAAVTAVMRASRRTAR